MSCRWVRLADPKKKKSRHHAGSKTGRLVAGTSTQSTASSDQDQGEKEGRKLSWLQEAWIVPFALRHGSGGEDAEKQSASWWLKPTCTLTAHWPRFGATVGSSVAVVSWMGEEELSKREKIDSTLPSKCRLAQAAWLVDHPLTLDAPSRLLMHGKNFSTGSTPSCLLSFCLTQLGASSV
jgi:hypothetical protein